MPETPTPENIPDNIRTLVERLVAESKDVPDNVKLYTKEVAAEVRKEALGWFFLIGAVVTVLTTLGVWGVIQHSVGEELDKLGRGKIHDELQNLTTQGDQIIDDLKKKNESLRLAGQSKAETGRTNPIPPVQTEKILFYGKQANSMAELITRRSFQKRRE